MDKNLSRQGDVFAAGMGKCQRERPVIASIAWSRGAGLPLRSESGLFGSPPVGTPGGGA